MPTVDTLVCAEPGHLRLERQPAPHPGAADALVRPRRVGICGTDYHIVVALFARLSGGEVLLLDRDAERADGVAHIAGVTRLPPDADAAGARPGLSDGDGSDVAFDATGSPRAMENGFDFVAHGGRYVLVGVFKEPITFMDPDFHHKELMLRGSCNATSEDFKRVIDAIRAGHVSVGRVVTHRTSLVGAFHGIPRCATDKAGLIKVLVEID